MAIVASGAIIRPSRRAQKKKDTRSRLVRAARELFVRQGYDATSIEQIAAHAGISRRTCFRYFPSKEGLAFPFRADRLARFEALLKGTLPGESAYENVRRACLVVAGDFMAQREEMVALERVVREHPALRARDRELDSRWEEVIVQALARAGDERLARLVAGAVIGMVRAALEIWLEGRGESNLVQLAHEIFAILDRGVLAHRRSPARQR